MYRNALVLGLFAVVTVGGVTLLQQGTASRIQASERAAQVRALGEILPEGSYDNDLLANSLVLQDSLLGNRTALPAYLALRQGEPTAIILQATAPDGYSGAIRLLVGINADGSLAGVRTLQHRETPGLGDKIELAKSDWILGFNGRSLGNPPPERWTVKKEGGDFDQFAGATVTPRAVINAVQRALHYFQLNRSALLNPEATGEAPPDALADDVEAGPATTHSRAGEAATRDQLQTTEGDTQP
ncbi:electron transport complex subunit RsxG [Stutzerimonas tarimensis]|uniref:Ion-translocating oxidoreductase complex subunit G n=1 Tax=Stutzerimonas tarimensis TaxID=1507735 RepID=A0ABV7T0N4_9GAMM